MLGRAAGRKNTTRGKIGYWYIHNAVDDCTRLAYSELLTDEKKETAAEFWVRANAYFESVGITVQRVLTDNSSCYCSKLFTTTLGEAIKHKRTRPYRPQTNGKVERFNRTALEDSNASAAVTRLAQSLQGVGAPVSPVNASDFVARNHGVRLLLRSARVVRRCRRDRERSLIEAA